MGMIGNQLATGTALTIANDSFNGNGSTTGFTLSQSVGAATDIEVLVDNVQQSPYDSSYSVSGTTLTFSAAPPAGTNNIYVIYHGSKHISTNQVVPDDGSVTETKLAAAAVTPAKMHSTLDLSGKTLTMPAGHAIQIQRTTQQSGYGNTTSTSFIATTLSVDITPKFANSLIKIEYQTVWWLHNTANAEEYFLTTVYRTISGGSATNIGAGANGRVLQWGSKYKDSGNAYQYNEGVNAFTFDTPNTTSSVNYKLYVASGGGNEVRYIDTTSENSIIATEIAQ